METKDIQSEMNQRKITVGFKCDPSLKLKLSNMAQTLGLTLSEYSESVMTNHCQTQVNPSKSLLSFRFAFRIYQLLIINKLL